MEAERLAGRRVWDEGLCVAGGAVDACVRVGRCVCGWDGYGVRVCGL